MTHLSQTQGMPTGVTPIECGLWVTMQVSAGSAPVTGVPPKTVLPAGEAAAWAGRAGNLYFPPFSEL